MSTFSEQLTRLRDNTVDFLPIGAGRNIVVTALVAYGVIVVLLGMYWSVAPGHFETRKHTGELLQEINGKAVTGTETTAALIGVMEVLLDKRGGFLHNDRFPPGVYLDNMPNWEFGALVQARDLARALRESFSRSQSQSTEDPDLSEAEPNFHFNTNSWILPATESEYRDGLAYLHSYFRRLTDERAPEAQFYARADNLRTWLATVETRLGSLSQRLSASVGQERFNTDLAGDAEATQSTATPAQMLVKTPWMEIDDVFFEARGTAWALIQFLRAIEVDFEEVLKNKNAQVSVAQIIRELEATQDMVWSPMILNGSGFGLLANHSLVMASYISRANAAIIDLRELLSQG